MAKDKGGRPTKMTDETVKKLEEAFANGATDVQACFYAGISKPTLYSYQEKYPEFLDRKQGLKSQLGLISKNKLANAIRQGDVAKAQWYLERTDSEFKLKYNQDHTSSDNSMTPQVIERVVIDTREE
jgi:hypothetical protein